MLASVIAVCSMLLFKSFLLGLGANLESAPVDGVLGTCNNTPVMLLAVPNTELHAGQCERPLLYCWRVPYVIFACWGNMVHPSAMARSELCVAPRHPAGAVPQLVTAWQGVSRAECQRAYQQAEAQYAAAFQVSAVLSGRRAAVSTTMVMGCLHSTVIWGHGA